jgi:transaldolase
MIFLDTAKPEEVKKWAHLISGVTCNPLILSRERPGVDPMVVCCELSDASDECQEPGDVSFQVWSSHIGEMHAQAKAIRECSVKVKLPLSESGLEVAGDLLGDVRPVNFTGIMSASQLIIACHMRAAYASLFWGRAQQSGVDPAAVCRDTQTIRDAFPTRLLVGSVRGPFDIVDAFRVGADVVTVQPAILQQLIHHDRTESTIREFLDAHHATATDRADARDALPR